MTELLADLIRIESISGHEKPVMEFVARWARDRKLEVDLWQSDEREVKAHGSAAGLTFEKHLPLENRPTLVIRLPGNPKKKSLLFNAHADVVAAPDAESWTRAPFAGEVVDGRIVGRGACDTKGPLAAALCAIETIQKTSPIDDRGDVLLELIPGEEDCVGLGTLTSATRGHRADLVIVLEPTENRPCIASRSGTRFHITATGKSVHGTVKWLGDDAIMTLRRAMDHLDVMEREYNDRSADALFAEFPLARPITVDQIHAGQWQGMISDLATCAGYFELLPADDIAHWQTAFRNNLQQRVPGIAVRFDESYHGHRLDPAHPAALLAAAVSGDAPPASNRAFNSGCEAGLRARLDGSPTLVWGPGNLAHAHARDESIGVAELQRSAELFADFVRRWCGMACGMEKE